MIKMILLNMLEVLIGFAGGLLVGGGLIAFIMLLGVIPRLAQLSKTNHHIHAYHYAVLFGTFFGTYMSFFYHPFYQHTFLLPFWGIFHGVFNGMIIAALAEVLNVLPILSKRVRMKQYIIYFILAIVTGKIAGSLFQWFIFMK